MSCVGIIVEFNPFHNGHLYLLEKAKEITGADHIVAVMSGNYVQRGTPAIINKYSRTQICLENGIDLVIELPVHYATASAEFFAAGAIALLDSLGIVNHLVFGSECGNMEILSDIAAVLAEEPITFKTRLKENLKQGLPFPKARSKALQEYFTSYDSQNISDVLSSPNNILAIEYLKILKKRKSLIIPHCIARKGAGYHDSSLHDEFISATAVRNHIIGGNDPQQLFKFIPESAFTILLDNLKNFKPHELKDYSLLLGKSLLQKDAYELSKYFGLSLELANRMKSLCYDFMDVDSMLSSLKTKNITEASVRRALLHVLLEICEENIMEYSALDYCIYIRILGFKKNSASLLTSVKEKSRLPLITKVADAHKILTEPGRKMLNENIYADHLYRMVAMNKSRCFLPNEYTAGIIRI